MKNSLILTFTMCLFMITQANASIFSDKVNTGKFYCSVAIQKTSTINIGLPDLTSFTGWNGSVSQSNPVMLNADMTKATNVRFIYSNLSLSAIELGRIQNQQAFCPELIERIGKGPNGFTERDRSFIVKRYQLAELEYRFDSLAESLNSLKDTNEPKTNPESFRCKYVPIKSNISDGEISEVSCPTVTEK